MQFLYVLPLCDHSNASDVGSDEVDGDEDGSEFGDMPKGDIQVSVLASVTLGELCILGQLAGIQVEAEVNRVVASISTKHSLTKTGKCRNGFFSICNSLHLMWCYHCCIQSNK